MLHFTANVANFLTGHARESNSINVLESVKTLLYHYWFKMRVTLVDQRVCFVEGMFTKVRCLWGSFRGQRTSFCRLADLCVLLDLPFLLKLCAETLSHKTYSIQNGPYVDTVHELRTRIDAMGS